MTLENDPIVVFVPVGIVSVDFNDFRDEAPARAALEVHDDVDGIPHVGLDGAIGQVHAALQDAAREAGKALPCGSGVDGRKAPGVSGVEKLKEIEGLASPDFAELRDSYACGWCELKDGQLSVVPHINSPQGIRRFTYPQEAEIIGRVTGVAMRIVNGGLSPLPGLPEAARSTPQRRSDNEPKAGSPP